MRILTIGTDITIFNKHSEARSRIESYGRLFKELHIIIYTSPGFSAEILSSGVRLWPTNSRWFFLRPFDAFRLGRRIIRKRGIDLISVQDPAESGLAGWLLKRATGLPLHIQVHIDVLDAHFRRNHWKERMRCWVARFILPRGDAFRVVSQRIRDSLNSKFKIQNSKIAVLPIFVDRERISSTQPAFNLHDKFPRFDFIILMVSRLFREKNIFLALDAFHELLKEFPKTGLVIVGDGPEWRKLELSAIRYSLSAHIKFEGWQDNLVSYYKTANLYLLTSNFEGYGRTAIEAAAAGLPVVMTDVGVAGEIIREGETGRVVPVGNKKALAQALREARQNYPEMLRMAARAQAEVLAMEPRTWEEYLEYYCKSLEIVIR